MERANVTQIAVIGSGPAGCYLAGALLRALADAEITIFDKFASPFGLVRYGIAADHQHTKAITRQFERMFADPRVRFAGNVHIGKDLSLEEINQQFDAVVLATGLTEDRELSLPGADLVGVYGAGKITRILNSYPGAPTKLPDLGDRTVIIGGGNVAIDILRFLVKDEKGFEGSDITDSVLNSYLESPVSQILFAQRSAPADSKGDGQMLKELAGLDRAKYKSAAEFEVNDEMDRAQKARVLAFGAMVDSEREVTGGPAVDLGFGYVPARILGDDKVTAVEFTVAGETVTVEADSVITAIGFNAALDQISELTATPSDTGRIIDGLYRTGWARRGPTGAIPENRACAKLVADEIVHDMQADEQTNKLSGNQSNSTDSTPKLGFDGLPEAVKEKSISFADWQNLDTHEKASAPKDRVRLKSADHEEMVAISKKDN